MTSEIDKTLQAMAAAIQSARVAVDNRDAEAAEYHLGDARQHLEDLRDSLDTGQPAPATNFNRRRFNREI